ncbi:hypothetical protein ESCO_004442 [Escovopsis weberi]|uniref:Uncharacterized protein n=1 Tax=Escovopsis weberi TaxID=150374 RepID=A0A0M8N6B4_ESCWE|nr:hypothetical protein ESCO_004442 [Escovopsis weberi]
MLVASVAAQTGDECVDQCTVKFKACCETKNDTDPNCLFFSDCRVSTLSTALFCQIGDLAGCDAFCFDGRIALNDGAITCGSSD